MWAGIVVGEAGGLVGSQFTNIIRNPVKNVDLESKALSTRVSAASAEADSEAGSPALVRSNVEANATGSSRLNSQPIVEEIASGHAYQKHVVEKGEFTDLGVATKAQFQELIENIVANPSVERRKGVDGQPTILIV
ncbi:hypothetical protein [Xanthomonas arboricola]|uniref:hypothetical protein n=1 Tax=Xanthomonas arboricola TaxID=56448 RepID=UPI0011B02D75|nr:hypothetical protein [Xanthomonas arboricola]MBB5860250.1 hypothetical protein [Xanthomonas arboricola]